MSERQEFKETDEREARVDQESKTERELGSLRTPRRQVSVLGFSNDKLGAESGGPTDVKRWGGNAYLVTFDHTTWEEGLLPILEYGNSLGEDPYLVPIGAFLVDSPTLEAILRRRPQIATGLGLADFPAPLTEAWVIDDEAPPTESQRDSALDELLLELLELKAIAVFAGNVPLDRHFDRWHMRILTIDPEDRPTKAAAKDYLREAIPLKLDTEELDQGQKYIEQRGAADACRIVVDRDYCPITLSQARDYVARYPRRFDVHRRNADELEFLDYLAEQERLDEEEGRSREFR